jgi:maleate cis-trans isomerase
VKTPTRIGFVSGGKQSMPHYASFTPLVPEDVRIDHEGLGLYGASLYEIANTKDTIVRRVNELAAEHAWDGVIVTAAPTEVLNPGLYDALKATLKIPFTTALHACVAALRVYGYHRVLLLTPFDARLNEMIVKHLGNEHVTALAPHSFDELRVPQKMSGDEVFELTRKTIATAGKVEAIYFQGAVLDPIKVIDRIEQELRMTVIASNPAMLWYILSRLNRRDAIEGYGRLLKEWPALPHASD